MADFFNEPSRTFSEYLAGSGVFFNGVQGRERVSLRPR